MRVLLISPYSVLLPTLWMPLGLPFMAARLQQHGHQVSVFDRFAIQGSLGCNVEKVNAAMQAHIEEFQPDLIGLSTISPLIYDTVKCAKLIRREGFQDTLLAGGYHATALPKLTLEKIPELEGVLAGEGEDVLSRFANGEDTASLPGFWWRDGGQISAPAIPSAQIANLDDLPLPAYELMDMAFYSQRNDGVIRRHNLRTATLVSSRGCQYRCRFCAESVTYGHGVRSHSAEYMLDWIQKLITDYEIEGVHFHDNDFLTDEARGREFCAGLQRLGLIRKVQWSIQSRADRLTPELVRLLKKSGCVLIEIGVEVGTQDELDHLRKGTTVDISENAVRICRNAGLDVHAYMLQRTEDETTEQLAQRLAWLKRAKPTSFQWSGINIFPGTPLYNEKGDDFFAKSDWSESEIKTYYATDHLSGITLEERKSWMEKNFAPFARWHWWRNAIGHYPLRVLKRHAYQKLLNRGRRFVNKFRPPARPQETS